MAYPYAVSSQSDPSIQATGIHRLLPEQLPLVYDIDMREVGSEVFYVSDGRLLVRQEAWSRPPRSRDSWDSKICGWREMLESGGAAWGAFDEERIAGMIVLRAQLIPGTAQLAALFVSRPFRRRGIARHLAELLLAFARASNARYVYVSATPSRSAVGFYQSLGFQLADVPDPELFELEPEDIHMTLRL